jgi:hypothetical protein
VPDQSYGAMSDPEPLDDRGADEPHPSRLAPDHPQRAAILDAHRAARESGATGYTDPATGYLVMTSDYLAARGTCCQQGCRHCPYVR